VLVLLDVLAVCLRIEGTDDAEARGVATDLARGAAVSLPSRQEGCKRNSRIGAFSPSVRGSSEKNHT